MSQQDTEYFTKTPEHMKLLIEAIGREVITRQHPDGGLPSGNGAMESQVEQQLGMVLSNPELLHKWREYAEKEEARQRAQESRSPQRQSPAATTLPESVQQQARAAAGGHFQPAQVFYPDAETRQKLTQFVQRTIGSQEPRPLQQLDPGKAASLSRMIDEVRAVAARSLPGLKTGGGEVEIYLIKDNQPNMEIVSFASRDGKHRSTLLVLTDKELDAIKDPAQLKATIAHELAHEIFKSNPELRNDPRFQPNTPEFKASLTDLREGLAHNSFTKTEQMVASAIEDPTARETYRRQIVNDKVQGFIEEAMADKMGLWLSKDATAARSENAAMKAYVDNYLQRDYDAIPTAEKLSVVPHPHPSFRARDAELAASAHDMERVQGAGQSVAPSSPNYAPRVPPAQPLFSTGKSRQQ